MADPSMTAHNDSPRHAGDPTPDRPSPQPRPAERPRGRRARRKVRDPFFDNARALLIVLVVVGHSLQSFDSDKGYLGGAIATWIYSFHMPAFVLISGYLSRTYRNEPRQIRSLISSMLVPLLIFQVIHILLKAWLTGDAPEVQWFEAEWTLWFLLALVIWRLITPMLRVLRIPLVFAVVIAVIGPLDPDLDATLTFGRVVGFLPFFVMGLLLTPELIEQIRSIRGRYVIGGAILAVALGIAFATHEDFRLSLFFMSTSYDGDDLSNHTGILTRLMVLVVGTIGTLAILLITPRGQHWFTAIGARSLSVYLLHAVLLMPVRNGHAGEWLGDPERPLATVVIIAMAIVLALLLSTKIVDSGLRWLTHPPIGHLLVKDEDPILPK
jgi:fucose 4-O-acetylase-like acetyltransferase